MARLLGDADPDLAKRFGLDQFQREQIEKELESADDRIKLVTFQEPPPRDDDKSDPIAYLPPGHTTYGILDRDHRHRAHAGETWFVEVVSRGGAYFLIPLVRFDIGQLGEYLPTVLEQLSTFVAKNHADALAEALESGGQEKLEEAQQEIEDLTAKLDTATEALEVKRAEVETLEAELEEARRAKAQRAAASPTPRAETKEAGSKESEGTLPGPPAQAAPPMPMGAPVAAEGIAVREHGNVLESPLFGHAAYDARFTPDLSQVHLTPSRAGHACVDGQVEVPGLARVDAEAAPRRYPVQWDEEAHAFVVLVGKGESVAAAGSGAEAGAEAE